MTDATETTAAVDRLVQYKLSHRLTAEQLAAQLGEPVGTVRGWLARRYAPTAPGLLALALDALESRAARRVPVIDSSVPAGAGD